MATGVVDFKPNTAPKISVLEGPTGGENYSENFSISLSIDDEEDDGFVVVIRLNNSNYSIDLFDCAIVAAAQRNITCEINIAKDLVPMPINRVDWRFDVWVVDNNSSVWTIPMASNYSTNNFSIWWTSPMLEDEEKNPPVEIAEETEQNRTLILGVIGVILGVIVAAGVMFRGFENRVFSEVPSPFREEE